MRRFISRLVALFLLLPIAGCAPSRQEADEKLGNACVESLRATLTDENTAFQPGDISYSYEKSYDGIRLRVVTVKGQYITSKIEDKTYTCRYSEEWSYFSYLPEFYNLEKDDEKYGNFNGMVVGDTQVLLKINDANHKSLN